jgi:hypothetical protein
MATGNRDRLKQKAFAHARAEPRTQGRKGPIPDIAALCWLMLNACLICAGWLAKKDG